MSNKIIYYVLVTLLTICVVDKVKCQWVQTFWPLQLHCFGSFGSNIYAGYDDGHNDGIMVSNDSGLIWSQELNPSNTQTNCLISSGRYFFAGNNGSIMRSSDRGGSWQTMNTSISNPFIWSLVGNGSNLFAGSVRILRSKDSGANWTSANVGIKDTNTAIYSFVASNGYLFASLYTEGAYRSSDNGDHWNQVLSDTECYQCYLATNDNTIFAIGMGSDYVLISSDNGTSWHHSSSISSSSGFGSSNESSIAAIGSNIFVGYEDAVGGIVLSTDEGQSWAEIGKMNRVNSLFIFGDYIFAGTNNTGVYRARLSDFIQEAVHAPPANISKFNILANPVTTSADFQFDVIKEQEVFELFDLLGRSLLHQQLSAGQASLHVNMQNMPAGIYFARLGEKTVRFAKM